MPPPASTASSPMTQLSNSNKFPAKLVTKLAYAQLTVFAVALITEILLLVEHKDHEPTTWGSGIWASAFMATVAILGLRTTRRDLTFCTLVSYMSLSILSVILSGVIIGGSIFGSKPRYNKEWEQSTATKSPECLCKVDKVSPKYYHLMLVCGLLQMCLCTWTALLGCYVVCYVCNRTYALDQGLGQEEAGQGHGDSAAAHRGRVPPATNQQPAKTNAPVAKSPPKYDELDMFLESKAPKRG